ncbi:MAG: PAS domain S-box protein, partial [Candidatus Omnitrophota bacterium]
MIYPIAIFDLIASLASLAALSILLRGWKRALQSGSKLLLTGTLVFILSYNLCHFLEWSGITKVLETIENLFGALIPMWWAFFLYALLKEAAERDLRMSEEKFSKAFRSSPVLMAVTRLADGHIVDVNESFADSLGYSREEAIGKTTLELNIWADPEQRKVFTEKFKERGQV